MKPATKAYVLALATALSAAPARAQDLADFDYENLAFRGVGFELGYLWPDKVEPTPSFGLRMDLGYLGPGLRIAPTLTYWSSRMRRTEVLLIEDRLASLIARQQPSGSPHPTVVLGSIDWSDLALALDADVVWQVPYGFLTYAGAGASVHFLNGSGAAIAGTFIEDLLDSVSAGLGLQAGIEYPVHSRVALYAAGRLELLEDIRYAAIRGGVQLQLGPSATGGAGSR